MPRARNIKPGFFRNEDLAECSFGDRVLFIGLWTLADREGRLEDRPKRIKIEIFPCDTFDVERGLKELVRLRFIRRYVVNGERYIDIPNFKKHQSPHHTEKPSVIPAWVDNGETLDIHATETVDIPLNPEPRIMNHESRTPNTDSLAAPAVSVEDVVSAWNAFAPIHGLSAVKVLTDKRKSGVRARLQEKSFDLPVIYAKIAASDFLRGLTGWRVDFDFVFCSAHNYVKIMEGKYDNGKGNGSQYRGRERQTVTTDDLRKSLVPPGRAGS
jgi:hypothetical protein